MDLLILASVISLLALCEIARRIVVKVGSTQRPPLRPGWVTTKDGRESWMPPKELHNSLPDLLWLRAQALLFEETVPVTWPRALRDYDRALEDPLEHLQEKVSSRLCPDDHVYELGGLGCVRCGISMEQDQPAQRRWDALMTQAKERGSGIVIDSLSGLQAQVMDDILIRHEKVLK